MPDLDDRSFASYLAAMQGLANGHELERSGDVVTRPRLWSIDRSNDSFKNKGRFEPPGEEYAGDVAEPPGGNPPLELDPLLLSRWTGPRGGTPAVTWNGWTLEIILEAASGANAEPEYLVLLHIDAAEAPTVQHLPLRWAFEDAAATVTSEVSYAGGTLRLVDVRDSAVGIQLNPTAVPEGDAGAMAEGELGDGGVDPSPDCPPAIILVDGENVGYAAPKHWWKQHSGTVADWIKSSFTEPAERVTRQGPLCQFEDYYAYPKGVPDVTAWVVAAATNHSRVRVLSDELEKRGFTRLNSKGPDNYKGTKQQRQEQAKDNADEVLRSAYEELLSAHPDSPGTTQLVLLNGDGAPSKKGPEGYNCFVWAANAHAGLCEGVPYWREKQAKPVVAVPFDIHNGCNNEWKDKKRREVSDWPKPFPDEWPDRRGKHVKRGCDLLARVFGTPGQQAELSAPTQARLSQFLEQYGRDGNKTFKPDLIKKWVKRSGLPRDALGSKYGLCARAVLGALRNESPLYTSRQFLYQDLVEKLQPGWARPAVAIAVACLALGVRRTQESDGP